MVGEEVINAHPWLGTFLVPPPPAKKIGEVRVDINRNKADLPEVLEARTVKGFTTVTSETVYNEVDDNEDRQYTFYDADGHLWSDFGEAPSAATSTPPGSSLLGDRWECSCTRRGNPHGHGDRAGFLRPCEQVPGAVDPRGHQRAHRRGLRGPRQGQVCRHARMRPRAPWHHAHRRHPVEGTYTSMIFGAGRTTTFGTATWTADVPSGTSLRFQVVLSSTAGGPWVFVGPDGTAGSYFTSSGTAFTTPPTGRYVRYQATFASDAGRVASPTLSGFNLSLGGATSRVVSYTYGPNGNVVSRTTVDSATGTTTDVRDSVTRPPSDRINTQDQFLRRDVTSPDGTTVTWRNTYDSAGNKTSKTDGTQTTSYAWDSHNRLVQVNLPEGATEAYTDDANGLMLSNRKSTNTAAATYVWRGQRPGAGDGSGRDRDPLQRCRRRAGVLRAGRGDLHRPERRHPGARPMGHRQQRRRGLHRPLRRVGQPAGCDGQRAGRDAAPLCGRPGGAVGCYHGVVLHAEPMVRPGVAAVRERGPAAEQRGSV